MFLSIGMLKQKYFLADIFILSAEKQPIKLSWRKIECLLYAQKARKVCGEYIYYVPTNQSLEQAKNIALDRAKIKALADEFGTIVSQTNSTVLTNENGKTDNRFFSLSGSEVKGEWLENDGEPQYEILYEKKVGYQYEVINKEFSAKEDFPSGGYDIQSSNAAMSLMKIIKNAFEGEFASYLGENKQVKIVITGSADASPIRSKIAYKGQYGEFVDEPYYKDGNLDNITVTKESGITQNEQLALLRAAGVMDYVKNNITTLKNTNNEFEYHVEVAKERGGEYRKINIEFVIVDAFPATK